MGGDQSDRRSVLVVSTEQTRTNRLQNRLRELGQVATADGVDAALDRLAWPDIDVLVVSHSASFDGVGAAEAIGEKHPCLPMVVFATATEASDAQRAVGTVVDEYLVHDGVDAVDTLAETVRELAAGHRDEGPGSTPPPSDPETANVDIERVDRLLAEGPDRQQLIELLHKSALFDTLLESIPVHLYVKDRLGRHLYVSSGYFEDDIDEFLDNTDPEIGLVQDRHARRAYEEDMYVVESGEAILDKVEYLPMLDQWNLTSKVPWRGPDGDVVGIIGVTRDISARKEQELAVKRQNEQLDAFARTVSHDLRNPLQLAKLRLEEAQETEPSEAALSEIGDALDRMDDLIGDVLALARQGEQVVDPEPVALEDVVSAAWQSVDAPSATVETDGDLGTVAGDEGRLRQLFANLFRNAIEHGGPSVTVRVSREGESLAISDDGSGLPPDEDLFQAGVTTADEGTGFGLSIVREIAEAHGWSVEATDSQAGGARFEFAGVERA